MSQEKPEYLFFPIVNERGFKVDSTENYQHMIHTIVDAQVELAQEFPYDYVVVYYELQDD